MTETGWLDRSIYWRRSGDVDAPWAASYGAHALRLRLGDFPAEPLYTLLVDGAEVLSLDSIWPDTWKRTVVLRAQADGQDRRSLDAYLEHTGDLALDGQDLGPSVERVFGEGIREYEWKRTVPAADIPRLLAALGASPGSDVLDALEAWLASHLPEQLERLILERGISSQFWSRAGD
jgi:hypothetical protein